MYTHTGILESVARKTFTGGSHTRSRLLGAFRLCSKIKYLDQVCEAHVIHPSPSLGTRRRAAQLRNGNDVGKQYAPSNQHVSFA